ncbi:hypothetical protein DESUT3_36750 [Desulfuromonas versatilis]|uniref:Flagellar protein FlgN n=1 Tax=Desulfuromonas versatilis TaxID=2802975 RepID=A0ABN6E2K8_9BACT|nr:hypothetical protein [Desulfuromonas versatilis]BCR06606.1 hypothetical protein DESUT3_36750 [Desulfuromonas versatilis]
MNGSELRERLQRLLELILRERDCARRMAMDELQAAVAEKEAMLRSIGQPGEDADPEVRGLAERIRAENRRNAFLFWSTLKWVRESMGFFGQQAVPTGYGAAGTMVGNANSGMILSGRV